MKAVKSALIATASAGALLGLLGVGPAMATPITYEWNPAATSGTALSTPSGGSPLAPEFSGNDLTIKDYASINISNLSDVTESAILAVTDLGLVSPSVSAPGFVNGSGGGSAVAENGATPYELYFVVNSTSTLSPSGSNLAGVFDTLTYTLYGDVGGNCSFSVSGSTVSKSCGADTQLVLATGSLTNNGINQVAIDSGIPSANADANIVAGSNAGGFFVAPTNLALLNFESAFTNTGGQVISGGTNVIDITGGGGNIDIVKVPEPETVAMFGFGLLGLGWFVRRRAKKS
jgi:hypothetical protein